MAGQISRPGYSRERELLAQGFSHIAGIDEAGRGALAGPVVAAAVILPPNPAFRWLSAVNDSKLMTAKNRERCAELIRKHAVAAAVGMVGPEVIDDINILQATRRAMHQAVSQLSVAPDYLLIDAVKLGNMKVPQVAIIHGDRLCLSIASASIVAKVARDRLMEELDAVYPAYGFARHKGYGTAGHLESLRRWGCCAVHRRTFEPVRERLL